MTTGIPTPANDGVRTAPSTGYLAPEYASSFATAGTLRRLPRCGGWLLEREIAGTTLRDATGLYPLFCCTDWTALCADLDDFASDLVSVCLVPDPFGAFAPQQLPGACWVVRPFKERFVAQLSAPPAEFISRHHRKSAMRGLRMLDVEVCSRPSEHAEEWVALHGNTSRRHGATGLGALSVETLRRQLEVPGLVMFRARHGTRTVAIHQWMTHGSTAYGHLAGHSDEAYRLHASYALYWHALHWFWQKVECVDLGGIAGSEVRPDDGLAFFKRGFANAARTTYIAGRILRADEYRALSTSGRSVGSDFFPGYRQAPGC